MQQNPGLSSEKIYCLIVNSRYHQAAKNVGECLKVTAAVKNGVIEALKSIDSQQVLVLQRRPEFLVETSPQIQIIFTDLIVRC
ncbi:gamma-glutamyl-gamma-aminobutyrate hydrolase family protein [Pediococcus pentosaceus]|uniref:gamma-glutamyl-gamma-aminobutyrate hydrolase family protein n=1 Tax=Pediococcus pentosaceus TaxID=1255 RepID=UPI0039908AFB